MHKLRFPKEGNGKRDKKPTALRETGDFSLSEIDEVVFFISVSIITE